MKCKILLPGFFVLCTLPMMLQGQTDNPGPRDVVRFGLFGGLQFNMHSGTYEALDNNAVCGICEFENGEKTGLRLEGLFEYPLSRTFLFSGRIGYQDFSGAFDRDKYRVGPVAQPSGPPVDMIVDQTFDNALSYLTVTPGILYFPIDQELHLNLGLGFAFPLSKDYTLREVLVSPSDKTFADGTTDHIIRDEEIQEVNGLRLALELGAGYDIPLTRNLLLTPEVAYSLPLTKVTGRGDWTAAAFAGGLGLRYAMIPPPKELPPPPPPAPAAAPATEVIPPPGCGLGGTRNRCRWERNGCEYDCGGRVAHHRTLSAADLCVLRRRRRQDAAASKPIRERRSQKLFHRRCQRSGT
ncbi:MAG: hypothetical protein M5R41_15820 [Bacteroidia bacterium]|nr:hypothetical protein [Bacteroidia bacterium]